MVTFAKILFLLKTLKNPGEVEDSFPYRREISKEEINHLDLFSYSGKITIIDSKAKLSRYKRFPDKKVLIGFDTETRPSFQKGIQHPCSLVQLAFEDEVILFRLNRIGFPSILADFLSHEEHTKIGIAIKDDLRQLLNLTEFKPAAFVDLNELCPKIGFESIGAKRLTALVLGKNISKRQQVSNWEAKKLSDAQIKYAATDAWICREIYIDLNKKGLIK